MNFTHFLGYLTLGAVVSLLTFEAFVWKAQAEAQSIEPPRSNMQVLCMNIGGGYRRCENTEVICYSSAGAITDSIQCFWKYGEEHVGISVD